ncbi:MAG: carbon-nitrogen hydrolase family protein [Victivallaceae bacterium]
MARYVTISAFGAAAITSAGFRGQEAVDKMIKHWNCELQKVLPDQPDLIIVPEACDRYSDMTMEEKQNYYQTRGNQVRDFFSAQAKANRCYIAYSACHEMPDGTWRNSTQIIDRQGNIAGIYSKNHLVIEETTEGGILCGKDAQVIETDFGKLACVICFDLGFDELRLKYAAQQPDLIVFCSMYHGGLMEAYWAYSCRAHFAGAVCNLPCEIISPDGRTLAKSTNYFNYVTNSVNLDCKLVHLDGNWEKLDAMRAKYGRKVKVVDPGLLASVLISSECDEFTVNDLIKEFDIELLDQYLNRSLAHHHNPKNIAP